MTDEQIKAFDSLASVLLEEMWASFQNNMDRVKAERACESFVKNIETILTPAKDGEGMEAQYQRMTGSKRPGDDGGRFDAKDTVHYLIGCITWHEGQRAALKDGDHIPDSGKMAPAKMLPGETIEQAYIREYPEDTMPDERRYRDFDDAEDFHLVMGRWYRSVLAFANSMRSREPMVLAEGSGIKTMSGYFRVSLKDKKQSPDHKQLDDFYINGEHFDDLRSGDTIGGVKLIVDGPMPGDILRWRELPE